jgi:ferrous iron transport protein B
MGVLYANDENTSLAQTLRESGDFTPQSLLAMMVFILFYIPCFATLLAIRQEAGTKWAIVSIVYNTTVAWVLAWVVYHVALWL